MLGGTLLALSRASCPWDGAGLRGFLREKQVWRTPYSFPTHCAPHWSCGGVSVCARHPRAWHWLPWLRLGERTDLSWFGDTERGCRGVCVREDVTSCSSCQRGPGTSSGAHRRQGRVWAALIFRWASTREQALGTHVCWGFGGTDGKVSAPPPPCVPRPGAPNICQASRCRHSASWNFIRTCADRHPPPTTHLCFVWTKSQAI